MRGMRLAQHPWVLPPGVPHMAKTYEDIEAVPVEVAVAVQTVPPAVPPCPGKEAEQKQVPEHSPHGGTGSGCGAAGREGGMEKSRQRGMAAAPASPAPAPNCAHPQPILSPPSLGPRLPPNTSFPSLPAKIILLGKEPGCLHIPKTDPTCPGFIFSRLFHGHESQPGLILAGGRGRAARP